MQAGRAELARVQPAYPGVAESIGELHRRGFVQTYGSDHRDRFQLAAVVARRYRDKFGVELAPGRTVVVGDAPNDIACARSAGFRVVVVAHRESREELVSHGPDAVLDHLEPELVVATITSLVRGT